jgi:hypothetical protein
VGATIQLVRSTANLVFRVAVAAEVNLMVPPVPVTVSVDCGAGVTDVWVLAEKLVTPGLGFTELVAVTAATKNLDFKAPDTVRICEVAPEIAVHPEGNVNDAAATRLVHENHWFE